MLCFPMLISSLPSANLLLLEHKIGVFVRFCHSRPSFSGLSSTKSRFLCFFGCRDPHFRAFRAQNRGFCALLPFETHIFGTFEHEIGIFVLGVRWFFEICPESAIVTLEDDVNWCKVGETGYLASACAGWLLFTRFMVCLFI